MTPDVLEKPPTAHKDPVAVIAGQADLFDAGHTLRQVLCVKG